MHAAEIVFVHVGGHLVGALGVDLPCRIARLQALAGLELEVGEPAGDRRADHQGVQAGAHHVQALAEPCVGASDLGALGRGQPGLLALAGLQLGQTRAVVGGGVGIGLQLGVGDDVLVVQLLADVVVVLGLQQVEGGLGDLALGVQPVLLQAQRLGADVAELAGDVGLLGGDVELELGIGQGGERRPRRHLDAVQHQHLIDLAA